MNMSMNARSSLSDGIGPEMSAATSSQQARCARPSTAFSSAPPALVLISISRGPSGPMWKSYPMKAPRAPGSKVATGGARKRGLIGGQRHHRLHGADDLRHGIDMLL